MERKITKNSVSWKYCECGCKGFEYTIGDLYFWCHMYLPKGNTLLTSGHGSYGGRELGRFASMEETNAAVVDNIRERGTMEKLETQLKELRRLLKTK